jgi:AraC family transcriptional regulator of adaptative response/methylated-DNA-[protein]-cysteine methyltransferase
MFKEANQMDARDRKKFASDEAKWLAVKTRDRSADGTFIYAVLSTGIYCRPGCPAREAKRENVRFFQNAAAAEKAGYRSCKRCNPNGDAFDEKLSKAV